jgi:hypothetical protein
MVIVDGKEPDADSELIDSELVLGLVAPVGANLNGIRPILTDRFEHFGYQSNIIRLSHLLRAVELAIPLEDTPPAARYKTYMAAGTEARKKSQRGDFLALSAAYQIQQKRINDAGEGKLLRRTAHILHSLKHPEEVHTLAYGASYDRRICPVRSER